MDTHDEKGIVSHDGDESNQSLDLPVVEWDPSLVETARELDASVSRISYRLPDGRFGFLELDVGTNAVRMRGEVSESTFVRALRAAKEAARC